MNNNKDSNCKDMLKAIISIVVICLVMWGLSFILN